MATGGLSLSKLACQRERRATCQVKKILFDGLCEMFTVSAPKRMVHLSIRTATRAGTCFEAVASALRASAGLRAAADGLEAETGAHSKLGPTQTAKFDADIIF